MIFSLLKCKKIFRIIFIVFIILTVGWLSLCGEYLQDKYRNLTFWGLVLFLLIASLYKLPKESSLIDFALFLYIFLVTLGLNFCENKPIAVNYYTLIILPIPFLYFSIHSKGKEFIPYLAWIFFVFGFCIAAIGILEIIFRKNIIYELWINNYFYERFIHDTPRIMSTQMHPTVFGSFLLGCIPFSYFLFLYARKPFKILIAAVIIMLILGVIFSFSRGNILGLAILSITYLLLIKRIKYMKFIIVGLAVLIIVSSTFLSNQFNFSRFSTHALTSKWWRSEKEKGTIAFKMLKDHPFTGAGLKHYHLNFDRYSSENYKQIEQDLIKKGKNYKEWRIADNMYFSILAETGLLGFSSFILLLFLLFKNSLVSIKKIENIKERAFLAANLSAIVGLLVSMNTYDLFYWIAPSLLFWFLIGSLRGVMIDDQAP